MPLSSSHNIAGNCGKDQKINFKKSYRVSVNDCCVDKMVKDTPDKMFFKPRLDKK